nr:hypothetical protein [Tanacetum cinerariifolium]
TALSAVLISLSFRKALVDKVPVLRVQHQVANSSWSYEPLTLTQAGTGRDILGSRIERCRSVTTYEFMNQCNFLFYCSDTNSEAIVKEAIIFGELDDCLDCKRSEAFRSWKAETHEGEMIPKRE